MYNLRVSNPDQARRAAIYARISEDRAGARLGVQRQTDDCRDLAIQRGWEVVAVYEDNDISAYSGKPRPGYRQLLDAIATGSINAVIAWHPDRLHRRPIELEGFINLVESHGVAVATVQAGEMDLSTPSGRLVARQLGSVARYESEHKAERIRRAIAQRRQAAQPHSGRRVYGYQGVQVIPKEAEHICWAVDRLCEGMGWNETVRGLKARGAVTSEGNPWDRRSLKRTIANPRLRGKLVHRGAIVGDGAWPAIVSSRQWALLQSRLDTASPGPGPSPRHLLSGILRCGKCGRGLVRGSARTRPKNPVPAIYTCTASPGGLRRGCGGITILQPLADDAVTAAVLDALGNVRPLPRNAEAVDELETVLTKLRERQQEIATVLARGELSVAVASQADAQLREEIEVVERQLAAALATDRTARVADGDVQSLWANLTLSERRALIGDVIESVVVKPVGRGWHGQALDRLEIVWRR
jgi:site-specific DNA recombinase